MNGIQRLALALVLAALIATGWWAAYTPRAWSLPVLIGLHVVLATVLERGLWALGARSTLAVLFALLFGLALVPMALAPINAAGETGSKMGVILHGSGVVFAVLFGGLAGEMLTRRRGIGLTLSTLLALVYGSLGAWGTARLPTPHQPTARAAPPELGFEPYGPIAVFGVDGGDWQIFDEMLIGNELPNFQALIERGRRGTLRSADPLASPVVWTTIFTGHTPTNHGVSSWFKSDARSRIRPMLWDIFGANERSSLSFNVPGTWPPNEVPQGTLLSGFPIPSMSKADTGQLSGLVLSTTGSQGYVPTLPLESVEGGWTITLDGAAPRIEPAVEGLSHVLIDIFGREGMLPARAYELRLDMEMRDGLVHFSGDLGDFAVAPGQWSEWRSWTTEELDARLKLHVLQADEQGLELFLSPTFQSPRDPRWPFATGVDDLSLLEPDGHPYIVEGLGWTAHRDERIAHIVPDLILDVERTHTAVAEGMLRRGTPELFSYVFTATDRLQHPYLSLRQPDQYPAWNAPPLIREADYVAQAYREADATLGRLLAVLPPELTLWVVSDHGVDANDPKNKKSLGESGHRVEGIWIAAGPSITATDEQVELRVVDVTPTVLYCGGLPVAADMDGLAVESVCSGRPGQVATWLDDAGTGGRNVVASDQMAQIKSLGYMEGDEE